MNLVERIKSFYTQGSKLDIAENIVITALFLGVVLLSLGIGISSINNGKLATSLAMSGSFIIFLSTIILVIVLFIKE